jgi:hypothetical protein
MKAENIFGFFLKTASNESTNHLPEICEGAKEEGQCNPR